LSIKISKKLYVPNERNVFPMSTAAAESGVTGQEKNINTRLKR
jgi:hypothetical protein